MRGRHAGKTPYSLEGTAVWVETEIDKLERECQKQQQCFCTQGTRDISDGLLATVHDCQLHSKAAQQCGLEDQPTVKR